MNTGQIVRSKTTDKNFTIVSNDIIRSTDLTLCEKGLLIYLLQLPSDWVLYKKNLYNALPDLPGSIDRYFKGLQDKGYIVSVRVINESSQFIGWNHIVYDDPVKELPTSVNDQVGLSEKPKPVFADFGKSSPILSTNDILSTELILSTNDFKNSIKNKKIEEPRIPPPEIEIPFGEKFKTSWDEWLKYRRERRLPKYSEIGLSKTFTKLIKDSDAKEEIAIEIIEVSMANNWQGLFPLKQQQNGQKIINGSNYKAAGSNSEKRIEGYRAWGA